MMMRIIESFSIMHVSLKLPIEYRQLNGLQGLIVDYDVKAFIVDWIQILHFCRCLEFLVCIMQGIAMTKKKAMIKR